jgi:hypothetical protein
MGNLITLIVVCSFLYLSNGGMFALVIELDAFTHGDFKKTRTPLVMKFLYIFLWWVFAIYFGVTYLFGKSHYKKES